MCQKAPKCADFLINPGEACPRPPYPRLAPTELAFMHSVNQNTHINSKTRCYDPEYRLELFCVKVCQVHNDPHALAWHRVFCARMKIFHVLNIASPPPKYGILDAPLRFYRYSVKHLGSRSGSTQRLLFCGLHHWYHTEFLAADIFRLVFSRRINKLKLKVGALIWNS